MTKVNRSAITGEYVTKAFANKNPKTTVTETVKPKPASKPTKKK